MKSLEFIEFIYKDLCLSQLHHSTAKFLIIAGAPAVGKTYICEELSAINQNIKHVEMESYFLHTRDGRRGIGLNGFDLSSYDMTSIENHYKNILDSKPFFVTKYDHSAGFLKEKNKIFPYNIICYEGFAFICLLHTFQANCLGCYFILPSDFEEWINIHISRDQKERQSLFDNSLLKGELITKCYSLKKSLFSFGSLVSIVQFLLVEFGEDEFQNEYRIVSQKIGGERLYEFDKL